jgi:preprotein translocase subunit SecE
LAVAAQSTITADRLKLAAAGMLFVAGVVGFYVVGTAPLVARIGILLVGVALAAAVGWTSETGKRFYAYCQDSVTETKKVVWPSRKETIQTTLIVVAFVIVMAVFLWIVDASLVWLVKILVGRDS